MAMTYLKMRVTGRTGYPHHEEVPSTCHATAAYEDSRVRHAVKKRYMPIYEYECRSCGRQFEFLMLPSTTPACPECRSQELERLLSGFAVSTDNTRQSSLTAARRRLARSSDVRDKKIDEAEHKYEHTFDNVDPKFRPPPPKAVT